MLPLTPQSIMQQQSFHKPFPALTPAQRYHLDVFGYVIVPDVLTRDECHTLIEASERLKAEFEKAGAAAVRERCGALMTSGERGPDSWALAALLEADPAFAAYATHARLVGMAEELIGGEARITELAVTSNVRLPDAENDSEPQLGFHTGMDIPYGTQQQNGLFHCCFVKTLTNLTDIGPDDGGTAVIAGSHKIEAPIKDIVAAAYEDRSLIHQVEAPAGSTLLFGETLIHATGQLRSDRRRYLAIAAYASRQFPNWSGHTLSDEFQAQIPENMKVLFNGEAHWTRGPKYRNLSEPVEVGNYVMGRWNER